MMNCTECSFRANANDCERGDPFFKAAAEQLLILQHKSFAVAKMASAMTSSMFSTLEFFPNAEAEFFIFLYFSSALAVQVLHLVLSHNGKYYGQNSSKKSRFGLLPTVTLLPHAVAELPNCLGVLVSDKSDSSGQHVVCTRCFAFSSLSLSKEVQP